VDDRVVVRWDQRQLVVLATIRAWVETGPEPRLRVRLTAVRDLQSDEPWTVVVASADEACEQIRGLLTQLAAATAQPPEEER
jgi:hypothetical protein